MSQRAYEIFGPDFHIMGTIDAERFPLLVRLIDKLAEDLRREQESRLDPAFEPMKNGG